MTRLLCVLLAFVACVAAVQVQESASLAPQLNLVQVEEGVVQGVVCDSGTNCQTYTCTTNCDAVKQDCQMTAWSTWGACSQSCGPDGTQSRSRSVYLAALNGGSPCPAATESRQCNNVICSVNCVQSGWSAYTTCSTTCGGGTQSRTRTTITQPQGNGAACGPASETIACGTSACPSQACTSTPWVAKGTCSVPCGGGTQLFSRTGTCSPLSQMQPCNTQPCPVNCQMNPWTPWSDCTQTCGPDGTTTRTRTVKVADQYGGAACPTARSQTYPCNSDPCPVDCVQSEWGPFSACSATCYFNADDAATVYRSRARSTEVYPSWDGTQCGDEVEIEVCEVSFCPIDCIQGPWTAFTSCDKSCGHGTQTQSRPTLQESNYGGKACGVSSNSQACNEFDCPVDCQVGSWAAWGSCSAECTSPDGASGQQFRTRAQTVAVVGAGKQCPSLSQSRVCNTQPCSADCQLSQWSTWGGCSKSCVPEGDIPGRQTRARTITKQPANGGAQCGCIQEERECNLFECPIDCRFTAFSEWSDCSAACRDPDAVSAPTQTRFRKVIQYDRFGGAKCPFLVETAFCNTQLCKRDCQVGSWKAFSPVCPSCYPQGSVLPTQSRTREIIVETASGGQSCPPLSETVACNIFYCPIDCEVNPWGTWSECTETCGDGISSRYRTIKQAPLYGGKDCPVLSERKVCSVKECSSDCVLSSWYDWSDCSQACTPEGGKVGTMFRNRTVLASPTNGGAQCGATFQVWTCNDVACPIDCAVSAWQAWGPCTAACGGGYRERVRNVVTFPNSNGKRCEALRDIQTCNDNPCPQDCVVSEYGLFEPCSVTCGGGSTARTRTVLIPALNGGVNCPALRFETTCNSQKCPVDCEVNAWVRFGSCSAPCGESYQNRERTIKVSPANGGKDCPLLIDMVTCDVPPCMVQCNVSQWRAWTACTALCGGGTRTRSREVLTPSANGAAACPASSETQVCNQQKCPQDCKVSIWGEWGPCNPDGVRRRSRTIETYSNYGGKPCPECLTEKDHCDAPMAHDECLVQPCVEEQGLEDFDAKDTAYGF